MNKQLTYLATAAIALISLSSCSDDNDPYVPNPDDPSYSSGAYILNQGNFYKGLAGGLNVIDYSTQAITENAFSKVNGFSIGDTPQCGICYGSRVYLGAYESNCIVVANKHTLKSERRILLGNAKYGQQPRSMVAHDGKIYISMYDGYVCRLDTTSLTIDASVKVGPNPEIVGIYNNEIYVPNSDGMNSPNYGTTASVIDLSSFTVTATFTVPMNPNRFAANESGLYLLCNGNYTGIPAKVYKVVDGRKVEEIAEATHMAVGTDRIYMINAPYGKPVEYKVYDCGRKTVMDWDIKGVDAPTGIAVDNIGGRIFITSNTVVDSQPQWDAPGYVNVYDLNGKLINNFKIGIGPADIFFNHY